MAHALAAAATVPHFGFDVVAIVKGLHPNGFAVDLVGFATDHLLERGVRFLQVWSGADNGFPRRNWDSQEDLAKDHGELGREMEKPAAALINDLQARGMLDDTIVYWTTEFGRMPCSQDA